MSHKPNRQTDALMSVWEVVSRYRWHFIVPAFLAAAGVLAVSLVLPRKYKAEGVFERKTDMVLTEITTYGVPRTFTNPRDSLIKEVAGEPALEELVNQLVPDAPAGADNSAGRQVAMNRQDLKAEVARKVQVGFDISTNELDRIRVNFVHNDPELAKNVVNLLIENYISRTRRQMESRLKQSTDFFRSEVERNQKRISELESEMLAFEIDHAQLLPDAPGGVQMQVSETQDKLATTRVERERAGLRVETLKKTLEQTPRLQPSYITGRNPDRTRLEDKLRSLDSRLNEYVIVQKMTPKHPELVALRQEMEQTRREIAKTPAEIIIEKRVDNNPRYSEIELLVSEAETELHSLGRKEQDLEAQAAKLDKASANLFNVRSEYRKLSRQSEEAQRQMAFWEDNLRRVDMAMAAENGQRGIIMDFIKPVGEIHKAISPNLVQVLLGAFVLALATGAVFVFIAHRSNDTVIRTEQLTEEFGLPLFGTVSEIISHRQRWLRKLRRNILYPLNGAVMATLLLIMGSLLYLNLEEPLLYQQLTSRIRQEASERLTPSAPQESSAPQAIGAEGEDVR